MGSALTWIVLPLLAAAGHIMVVRMYPGDRPSIFRQLIVPVMIGVPGWIVVYYSASVLRRLGRNDPGGFEVIFLSEA
jgi:small neutral amino acid transporter SnatA (MarC family)